MRERTPGYTKRGECSAACAQHTPPHIRRMTLIRLTSSPSSDPIMVLRYTSKNKMV
uniref:Uncharacterized protein n=1 Tax=Papilio polytes TaxID=76194 RepID=I4DN61_PAPPL|nr:unknown unsecreted protein [Papilio polytes]